MSDSNRNYDVQVDWPTVVPLGDTLVVKTDGDIDGGWVEAFDVVLHEHERQTSNRMWRGMDFQYASEDKLPPYDLFLRGIDPDTQSSELRRIVDDLVRATNTVAQVGTHVYELARELRQPKAEGPRESTPPPGRDPIEEELGVGV